MTSEHKLSVLHISPAPPQLGGMEAYMGDLLKSSLVERHSVQLLNISKPRLFKGGVYKIRTGYAGAFKRKITITLTSYAYSLTFLVKFLFHLARRRIDIVHIHTASYTSFWEKCIYILFAKAAGRKVVLHVHGALFREFYENSSNSIQALIRKYLNKCDAVIALSSGWKTFLSTLVGEERIYVVRNGIDQQPFRQHGQQSNVVRFLHIGEVSQRKGVFDLIEAAAILKRKGLQFQIDLAGPGEIREAQEKARRLDVADRLTVHGPRRGEEKYKLLQMSQCFVLASYGEGLPISILEALAAGLPVISTPVGGIPEVISDEVNGILIEQGNSEQLANAMERMIKDQEMRKKMSKANLALARKDFDIEQCAEKISRIYRDVCKS